MTQLTHIYACGVVIAFVYFKQAKWRSDDFVSPRKKGRLLFVSRASYFRAEDNSPCI